MTDNEEVLLGQLAVKKGFISREELDEALAEQERLKKENNHKPLGEILVSLSLLTQKQAERLLQDQRERAGAARRIGHFEVYAKLGEGGMGAVYLAKLMGKPVRGGDVRGFPETPEEGPLVALKILPPKMAKDENFLVRFRREVEVLSRLEHPNIVRAVDWGRADGLHFLAMEFIQGENSFQKVSRDGPMDERESVTLALEMARALDYASSVGILHRDIKPENILIDLSGVTHLTDFGLVSKSGGADDAAITSHGTTVGTPYYISPEQAQGSTELDIRSDLYSLGATLFHLLTGEVPYDGETAPVIMTKHVVDPVPEPLKIRPRLSPSLAAVIMKLMAKSPRDRYQTPADLIDDLQRIWRGEPPLRVKIPKAQPAGKTSSSPGEKRRSTATLRRSRATGSRTRTAQRVVFPILALSGAAVLVILGGYIFYSYMSSGNHSSTTAPSSVPKITFVEQPDTPPEPSPPMPEDIASVNTTVPDVNNADSGSFIKNPILDSHKILFSIPLNYGAYVKNTSVTSDSGYNRLAASARLSPMNDLRFIVSGQGRPISDKLYPDYTLRFTYLARNTGEKIRIVLGSVLNGKIFFPDHSCFVDIVPDGQWHQQQFLLRYGGISPEDILGEITVFATKRNDNAELFIESIDVVDGPATPPLSSTTADNMRNLNGWTYSGGICYADRPGSFLDITYERPGDARYMYITLYAYGNSGGNIVIDTGYAETDTIRFTDAIYNSVIKNAALSNAPSGKIRITAYPPAGGRVGIAKIVIHYTP